MDLTGAVLLSRPDTLEAHQRRQMTKLIRVGGKLAVLGVEDRPHAAMGWWHVARPGSYAAPQGNSWGPDQEGANLVYGRGMCGRIIVTNGYAADFRPPDGSLCPACREQI